MNHLLLFFTVIFSASLYAFDIETIDETKEGIEQAKKKAQVVKRAADGKVILKTLPRNIITPMKRPLIKPMIRLIIYPIGALPPKTTQSEHQNEDLPETKQDDVFLSEDQINKSNAQPPTIEFDSNFEKSTESQDKRENTNQIAPVNIE